MATWPWLKDELDTGWPRNCPACGAKLDVNWLMTTTRASDGVRRPGVGLVCQGCTNEYDWQDEDGYDLLRRRFSRGLPGPGTRSRS